MKFLCDEQVPRIWAEKLMTLGFDVQECTRIPELRGRHDVQHLLPWANQRRLILVSCDLMRDQSTRMQLLERLHRTKSGRLLYIAGGPGIGWHRGVGKFIVHYRTWNDFFTAGHGLVTLSDERPPKCQRIDDLAVVTRKKVEQGFAYMYANQLRTAGPKNPNKARPQRPVHPPAASAPLPE